MYLVVVTRMGGLALPLPMASAISRAKLFEQLFHVAEDGPAVGALLLDLLNKVNMSGKQVHDTNIVATMLANSIDALLTDNTGDFNRFNALIRILRLVP